MINVQNLSLQFKEITTQINKTAKEIASGKKENISSQDLGQSLTILDDIRNYEFINKNIDNNKLIFRNNELSINSFKNNLEGIKSELLKLSDSTNSNNKNIIMESIKSFVDDINKVKETTSNKLLVGMNQYKKIGFNSSYIKDNVNTFYNDLKNNTTNNYSSNLTSLNDIYDDVNFRHSLLGMEEFSVDEKYNLNKNRITFLKEQYSNYTDIDYTEAIINLKSYEINYQALASTISKVQNLSLVNFLK